MYERFSETAAAAVKTAVSAADALKCPEVLPDHLLLGIITTDDHIRSQLASVVTADEITRRLSQTRQPAETAAASSPAFKRILAYAAENAEKQRLPIQTAHLLAAILREGHSWSATTLTLRGLVL